MHGQEAVTYQKGEELAQKFLPNSFFAQVSAKENEGIAEMFQTFAEKLYYMHISSTKKVDRPTLKIEECYPQITNKPKEKKKCSC